MIPRRSIHMLPGEMRRVVRPAPADLDPGLVPLWEDTFTRWVGVGHGVAVSSGREGMDLLFEAMGIGAGDEVIIPAYTLKALVGLLKARGIVPVAADVEPDSFNIDPAQVRRRIGPRTRAVLAAHLFGSPCRIAELMAIGRETGVKIVEDCAHSVGASIGGRMTGAWGDAAFFSFEMIKPVNTYGGGMVVTHDAALAGRLRALRGQREARLSAGPRAPARGKVVAALLERALHRTPVAFLSLYLLASPRWNRWMYRLYRLSQRASVQLAPYSPLQARLGLDKLPTLDGRIDARTQLARRFEGLLPSCLKPQRVLPGARVNYYFYVTRLDGPDPVRVRLRLLLRGGVDAGILAEVADDCAPLLGQTDCPNSARVFATALYLPLYEGMTQATLEALARALEKAVR